MTMLYDDDMSGRDREAFADGYVAAADWVRSGFAGGVTADEEATLRSEAAAFLSDPHAVRLLQAAAYRREDYTPGLAGHDFYLTRERHGAGFWDRGLGLVGDALTALARPYGSSAFDASPTDED